MGVNKENERAGFGAEERSTLVRVLARVAITLLALLVGFGGAMLLAGDQMAWDNTDGLWHNVSRVFGYPKQEKPEPRSTLVSVFAEQVMKKNMDRWKRAGEQYEAKSAVKRRINAQRRANRETHERP